MAFLILLNNENILVTLSNKILSQFGTFNVQPHVMVKPPKFIQNYSDSLLPVGLLSRNVMHLISFLFLLTSAQARYYL